MESDVEDAKDCITGRGAKRSACCIAAIAFLLDPKSFGKERARFRRPISHFAGEGGAMLMKVFRTKQLSSGGSMREYREDFTTSLILFGVDVDDTSSIDVQSISMTGGHVQGSVENMCDCASLHAIKLSASV